MSLPAFEPTEQNIVQLVNLLEQSVTNSEQVINQLDLLKDRPGFHYTIFLICTDLQHNINVRGYAASFFKNSIRKWWKRTATNTPSPSSSAQPQQFDQKEPERKAIRHAMLAKVINVPNPHISTLLSDAVGNIASMDFPVHWPEFLQEIFTFLQSTSPSDATPTEYTQYNTTLRCFDILNLFMAGVTASSPSPTRTTLITQTLESAYKFWNIYSAVVVTLLQQVTQQSLNSHELTAQVITALRVLQHITDYIAKVVKADQRNILSIHDGVLADSIFQSFGACISQLQTAITKLPSHEKSSLLRNYLNSIRGSCSTSISECITLSPVLFRKYLQPYTELFVNIIVERAAQLRAQHQLLAMQHSVEEVNGWDPEDDDDLSATGQDPCVINAFSFLTKINRNPSYRPIGDDKSASQNTQTNALLQLQVKQLGGDAHVVQETQAMALNIMNDTWTASLAEVIITNFFIKHRYDIHMINDNGEQYWTDTHRERNEDNSELMAAAMCFTALLKRSPRVIVSQINSLVEQTAAQVPMLVTPNSGASLSDAIYQSWLTDAVLIAATLIQKNKTDFENITLNITPLINPMITAIQNFVQTISGMRFNSTQIIDATSQTVREGVLRGISFEQYPTIFQRMVSCFSFLEELTEEIEPALLLTLVPFVTQFLEVDNVYIRLCALKLLRVVFDASTYLCVGPGEIQSRDDLYTRSNVFPYFISSVSKNLLSQLEEDDNKFVVLGDLRVCLDGHSLSSTIKILQTILPLFSTWWGDFGVTQPMLSACLFRMVTTFVCRLGSLSYGLHGTIVFMLRSSLDIASPDNISLVQSGIELWAVYLKNIPYLPSDLFELFSQWIELYTSSSDMYDEAGAPILDEYLLLCANTPQQQQDAQITCTQYLPNIEQQFSFPRLPPPCQRGFFDTYAVPIFSTLNNVFTNTDNNVEFQINAIDNIINAVRTYSAPQQLFTLPSFDALLHNLFKYLMTEAIVQYAQHGTTAAHVITDKSSVFIAPRVIPHVAFVQAVYGAEPMEFEQPVAAKITILFSYLMLYATESTVKFLANITIPLPNAPPTLSNGLGFFFFTALRFLDENIVQQVYDRKTITHAVLHFWRAKRIAQKANFTPFLQLADNADFVLLLLSKSTIEADNDQYADCRYSQVVLPQINMWDSEQQVEEYSHNRRCIIIDNTDRSMTTPLSDALHLSLGIVLKDNGPQYLEQLIKSLPFELQIVISPAQITPQ